MKVEILCSDPAHPVMAWLERWRQETSIEHEVRISTRLADVGSADVLFLISCTEIVPRSVREWFRHVFVLHASDLPKGRGLSPLVWELVSGAEEFTLTLLEAEDAVDTGRIWAKEKFLIPKSALLDEINSLLFSAELRLMSMALQLVEHGFSPCGQQPQGATYYPRRTLKNSEINPSFPLADSFDLIRVSDPIRYPAFFRLHGRKYAIELRSLPDDYAED